MIVNNFSIKTTEETTLNGTLCNDIEHMLVIGEEKQIAFFGKRHFFSSGVLFSVKLWSVNGETVLTNIKLAKQ